MNATRNDRVVAKSAALYRAAAALIPSTATAALGQWFRTEGSVPVITKGKGGVVIDVDGNEYIDLTFAQGATLLGHADERVVVAINKTASKGADCPWVSETEVRLAELIVSRFPSIDMVRFAGSPTEAFLEVIRLARFGTGRNRILVFEGSLREPLVEWVTPEQGVDPVRRAVSYNDTASAERVFSDDGEQIAAVIVEPVATGFGLVPSTGGFLAGLRSLCDAHGTLLVYDETVTGLRMGPGLTPAAEGVVPDLVLFGAALGGGLPLGAYGGRKAIMKRLLSDTVSVPFGPMAGSLLGMAAGIAVLQTIGEPGFYDSLEAKAARFDEGLHAAAATANVPLHHARMGSLVGMAFTSAPVTDPASARASDRGRFERFFNAMLDRGVLLPPSPSTPVGLCATHTDEQIDRTIVAAHEALQLISGISSD